MKSPFVLFTVATVFVVVLSQQTLAVENISWGEIKSLFSTDSAEPLGKLVVSAERVGGKTVLPGDLPLIFNGEVVGISGIVKVIPVAKDVRVGDNITIFTFKVSAIPGRHGEYLSVEFVRIEISGTGIILGDINLEPFSDPEMTLLSNPGSYQAVHKPGSGLYYFDMNEFTISSPVYIPQGITKYFRVTADVEKNGRTDPKLSVKLLDLTFQMVFR